MPASYWFRVRGRVQGVHFRQSTREQARALGLQGWVANRGDGDVEGLACGEPSALAALHAWLRQGPPAARVDGLEWQACDEPGPDDFEVRR